jgi:acetyl/propionyl-CoA carboxylase alpha subunit
VRNNIEFLRRIVSTPDFVEGNLDTGFLDQHQEVFSPATDVPAEALLVASAVGALYDRTSGSKPPLQTTITDVWNSGSWRNS